MVLEVSVLPNIVPRNMERRTSSPIGIPSAKLAALHAKDLEIPDDESSENKQQVESLKNASQAQQDGSPANDMYFEGLPEGSPAFSHVFNALTQELYDEIETKLHVDGQTVESKTSTEKDSKDDSKESTAKEDHGSPRRVRKHPKTLTFNCVTTNNSNKGTPPFRRRTKSATSQRVSQANKEQQYKMHPTPSLVRKERAAKGNVNSSKFVFHVIPKYKFLTETVTVSHEDLVKEQEFEQQLQSPKSIFGSVDKKGYVG